MTFKVGDKGKTPSGEYYEVVAELYNDVRDRTFLWVIVGQRFRTYTDDGALEKTSSECIIRDKVRLLPSKQKIEGWMHIFENGTGCFTRDQPVHTSASSKAIFPITMEYTEGDGL